MFKRLKCERESSCLSVERNSTIGGSGSCDKTASALKKRGEWEEKRLGGVTDPRLDGEWERKLLSDLTEDEAAGNAPLAAISREEEEEEPVAVEPEPEPEPEPVPEAAPAWMNTHCGSSSSMMP